MNKKSKLISIFFLSSLLFLSTINVVKAAPPSWVGVSAGESFTWNITVNVNTALTIVEDINSTGIIPNVFGDLDPVDLFGTEQEVQIRVRILSVTDLLTRNNVEYVNVSCSLSLILPDTTTVENVAEFGNIIFKYVPNEYTRQIFDFGGEDEGPGAGGLFIPTDINWAELIVEANSIIGMIANFTSGITFTALTNGTRATFPGQTIDMGALDPSGEGPTAGLGDVTLRTIQVTIVYNSNGVLNTAEITYGGETLLSLALTTSAEDQEIPSYEVPIILITTSFASIGIIYYMKKKKRLG